MEKGGSADAQPSAPIGLLTKHLTQTSGDMSDEKINEVADEIIRLLTTRDTLQGIDNAEKLSNRIRVLCADEHRIMRMPGIKLQDVAGASDVLAMIKGRAGDMLVDLQNGHTKDAFGKIVARLMYAKFQVDKKHTNTPGNALGDGGDGALLLHARKPDQYEREVRVEVRTVVPENIRDKAAGGRGRLPPLTGVNAGKGSWRPRIPHASAEDLMYIIIMWRVRELPSTACTLRDAARRSLGWVVVMDNAETFARMMKWKSHGPTLNPRNWFALPETSPPFNTVFKDGSPVQTTLVRPPTRVCAWIPGLVDLDKTNDSLAYWDALSGIGDRDVTGGVERAAADTTHHLPPLPDKPPSDL